MASTLRSGSLAQTGPAHWRRRAIAGTQAAPLVKAFFDEPTFTATYVVTDPATRKAAIIDSVLDFDQASGGTGFASADAVIAYVQQEGLTIDWLLETHVHADHLSAAPYLQEKLGGKLAIGADIVTEYKQLSPNLAVRPQVQLAEIGELAAQGYKGIINARPDNEEPGQPKSAELEAEAKRHGLAYTHVPVVPRQATAEDAAKFADALRQCDGKVVGFCRTGARAAGLWELANKPE